MVTGTLSTDKIVPASELAGRRRERERQRRERRTFTVTILGGALDDDEDKPSTPASQAQQRETQR
jgi:hypothetical protein